MYIYRLLGYELLKTDISLLFISVPTERLVNVCQMNT